MAGPIRILHVVVNMNRGGAETLLMNLYRNINRAKVQFDFLTCKEGAFDSEIIEMGGKIHRIPYVTAVGHKGYVKALDIFFNSNSDYKIIHSHMDKMSGLVLRSAKKANIPIRIAHSHNTQSEGGVLVKIYKWLAGRKIKNSATHKLACSIAASKWLFGNKKDSLIIKNGVDLTKFTFSSNVREKVRYEFGINPDTFVVGHVGRFNRQKNHSFLIEIFKDYSIENPNSKLILVGDGPLKDQIKQKVRDGHLENQVELLGVKDNISELIQGFDAFVFPSLHEGLPVTLIEAQAIGVPCLVSETVTQEVDLGLGLISFFSLENKSTWAKELKALKTGSIKPYHKALRDSGYDISESARNLENYYFQLST
ncbi:glycosyltransferase family 1 protein [Neobacillus drentensis]|uniref:glycosyltransferase family 1 protein n=1 Tax=Neobacillus drentensis TaxID=220684 RepID=UPI002FFFB6C4